MRNIVIKTIAWLVIVNFAITTTVWPAPVGTSQDSQLRPSSASINLPTRADLDESLGVYPATTFSRSVKFSSAGKKMTGKAEIKPSFKGAIFNLHGVIVDSINCHYNEWKSVFEEEFRKYPHKYYQNKKFTFKDFLDKVYGQPRRVGAKAILTHHSDKEIEAVYKAKWAYFLEDLAKQKVKPCKSTIALIEQLKGRGIKVALATASAEAHFTLEQLGIEGLFDVIVTSTVPETKEKGIFSVALEQLGFRPEECIVFDDSQGGLKSAKEAGMLCVGVDRINRPGLLKAAGADRVVKDLGEIDIKAIEKIFAKRTPFTVEAVDPKIISNLQERLGVEQKTIDEILDSVDKFLKNTDHPERIKKREPRTSWESLLYYIYKGMFYLGIDDNFNETKLSEIRTDPYVDGVPTYLDRHIYINRERQEIIYGEDRLDLPEDESKTYYPVYIIHIPAKDFKRYKTAKEKTEFLAKVIIHEWIEHFMPYYEGRLPGKIPPHLSLFAPTKVQISALKKAIEKRDVGYLYSLLKDYDAHKDPAGTFKKAIFEALEEIEDSPGGDMLLLRKITDGTELMSWYRYQLESRGLNITTLSELLEIYKGTNQVIAENIDDKNNGFLFNFEHPVAKRPLYLPQIYMPQHTYLSEKSDIFQQASLVDDTKRQKNKTECRALEEKKKKLQQEIARLRNLLSDKQLLHDSIKGEYAKSVIKKEIEALKAEITQKSGKMRKYTFMQQNLYAEGLVPLLTERISRSAGTKCFIIGIWGGSSLGKNTLSTLIKQELYHKHDFNEELEEIVVMGADSYLHSGRDGRYIELKMLDGNSRFTFLRGDGIYDLIDFYRDITSLKAGRSIKLIPDIQDVEYIEGTKPRKVGPGAKVVILHLGALGVDKRILNQVDLLLPSFFEDSREILERRLFRDTQRREEGGQRALSVDYILNDFAGKQLTEQYESMDRLMGKCADVIWQPDTFTLFERKDALALSSEGKQATKSSSSGTDIDIQKYALLEVTGLDLVKAKKLFVQSFENMRAIAEYLRENEKRLKVTFIVPANNESVRMQSNKETGNPNSEDALRIKVSQLVELLGPYADVLDWQLVIADNRSTDGTPEIAQRLFKEYPEFYNNGLLRLVKDPENYPDPLNKFIKGGTVTYCMRRLMEEEKAKEKTDVFIYTDLDRSVDLRQTGLLLGPMVLEDKKVCIGSRNLKASVKIGTAEVPEDDIIRPPYSFVTREFLKRPFKNIPDTQCSFKAYDAGLLRKILPHSEDVRWAFDTELLALAMREGRGIGQVPILWCDSVPESKTNIKVRWGMVLDWIRQYERRLKERWFDATMDPETLSSEQLTLLKDYATKAISAIDNGESTEQQIQRWIELWKIAIKWQSDSGLIKPSEKMPDGFLASILDEKYEKVVKTSMENPDAIETLPEEYYRQNCMVEYETILLPGNKDLGINQGVEVDIFDTSPWRREYAKVHRAPTLPMDTPHPGSPDECIFCSKLISGQLPVLLRFDINGRIYILTVNLKPWASKHMMLLSEEPADQDITSRISDALLLQRLIGSNYNIGFHTLEAAASIPHFHLHIFKDRIAVFDNIDAGNVQLENPAEIEGALAQSVSGWVADGELFTSESIKDLAAAGEKMVKALKSHKVPHGVSINYKDGKLRLFLDWIATQMPELASGSGMTGIYPLSPIDLAGHISVADKESLTRAKSERGRLSEILIASQSGLEDINALLKSASAGKPIVTPDFKGAIVDFDGVIVDTVPLHFRIWKEIFDREFGRYPTKYGRNRKFTFDEFSEKVNGRSNMVSVKAVLPYHSEKELAKICKEKRAHFVNYITRKPPAVFDSTIGLIKQLRNKGIKIALGTASHEAAPALEKLGIRNLFDVAVDSSQVADGTKLAVFSLAAKELGLEPKQCIVIEDAKSGVEAAKEAGMHCIAVDRVNRPDLLKEADLVVKDLEEVDIDEIKDIFRPSPFAAKSSSAGEAVVVSNFKGAIFDLDGVIADTNQIHFRVWKMILEEEFYRYPAKYDPKRKVTFNEYLEAFVDRPGIEGARIILPHHSRSELEIIRRKKQAHFLDAIAGKDVRPFDSTIALIKDLKAKNIKVAVSTTNDIARHILKKLGILELFDTIVDHTQALEEEPGSVKTCMFQLAAERLKIRPEECIVFEDSKKGVELAQKAGMLCIGVDRINRPNLLRAANYVVKDLKEIDIKIIENIFNQRPPITVKPVTADIHEYLKERLGIDAKATAVPLKNGVALRMRLRREPMTSWESLFYYIINNRFYFSIDDFFNENNLSSPRTDPYVDGVATYLTLDTRINPKEAKVVYEDDYITLPKVGRQDYKPVYIVHIPKKDLEKYKDKDERTEFLATVLIHEWIEHFMPYYDEPIPEDVIPHQSLFAPSGSQLAELKEAVDDKDIANLYSLLDDYFVFSDPAGTFKKAIFEALEEIDSKDKTGLLLIAGITNPAELLAWYTYQFEYKGLDVSALSALLETYTVYNEIIEQNISPDNNKYLFKFIHPETGQVLYMPQNICLSENPKFEAIDLIDDTKRLQSLRTIHVLEKQKEQHSQELANLRGSRLGKYALLKSLTSLREHGVIVQMKRLESEIDRLNKEIRIIDTEIYRLSRRQIYLYAEGLIPTIQDKINQYLGQKRPFIFAIWGGSSAGKTTLCGIIRNMLYATQIFDRERMNRVIIVGSDNFLHSGADGRYIEYLTEKGIERFTILGGPGIYDLMEFFKTVERLRMGGIAKVMPDRHDRAYQIGLKPTQLGPDAEMLFLDLSSLGIDKKIMNQVDFLLPVVFKDAREMLKRQLFRDTRAREEGGERALSIDSLLNMFVKKQLQENRQAMDKLVLRDADIIWQQDTFKLFRRKQTAAVKLAGESSAAVTKATKLLRRQQIQHQLISQQA